MYSDRRQKSNYVPDGVNSSDEIDIIEVLKKIWRGRVLIVGMVLVAAIIAFIALRMTTSYYKIEATIDAVAAIQLRPLSPSALGNAEYQVPVLNEKKIFDRVLLQVNSLSLLKDFWEKKTGKALDLSPDATPTEESITFKKFYRSFVLEASNPKLLDVSARKVSLVSESPTKGVDLLNSYLDFVNQQMWLEQSKKLEESYNANLSALTISYDARNLIEQQNLSDRLVKVRENVKIAESLGIRETPFKSLENIQLKVLDSQDYLLGTKSLMQQVDILVGRQGHSLAPYSVDLRNMETWLAQMRIDRQRLKESDGKILLFSIVNKPTSSIDPVAPKKMLIFLAVIFFSGIFGVFIVLVRSAIQTRRNQTV
jgi:chain length determinant protein (polysaccharide antigen chain regulator)